eukprot:scaffold149660_cov20-Tisochrysis_lutea.AAC.2
MCACKARCISPKGPLASTSTPRTTAAHALRARRFCAPPFSSWAPPTLRQPAEAAAPAAALLNPAPPCSSHST